MHAIVLLVLLLLLSSVVPLQCFIQWHINDYLRNPVQFHLFAQAQSSRQKCVCSWFLSITHLFCLWMPKSTKSDVSEPCVCTLRENLRESLPETETGSRRRSTGRLKDRIIQITWSQCCHLALPPPTVYPKWPGPPAFLPPPPSISPIKSKGTRRCSDPCWLLCRYRLT